MKHMPLPNTEQPESNRFEDTIQLVAEVFNSTLEGIMIADVTGRILAVNSIFSTVTGYSSEEAIGCKTNLLNSGSHDVEFYVEMWATIYENGYWQGEILNRRKNGEVYLEWLKISAIKNAGGKITHFVGVFTDLTDLKQREEFIRHQANHDTLTGLPNRQMFQKHFQAMFQRSHENNELIALLFLDLDRFKGINDSFGHVVGDALLKAVVERLKSCLTPQDVIARIGGDEFAILLTGIFEDNMVSDRVQQIAESMKRSFYYGQNEFFITASMGISVYPTNAKDTGSLMKYADTALYRAKEKGGNYQQFYAPELNIRAVRRQFLENSLHKALERNEFVVFYQPKIKVNSGVISGMEALIRWEHPELGLIPPTEFIPLAEEMGVIEQIGEWVLRTSCKQTKEWHDQGFPKVRVSVNLSTRQFQRKDLVTTIARIIKETGIEPQFLELEMTESLAMTHVNQAILMLKELKQLGVTLSLDDFGTGYSSLSYLTRFPIDSLKIDRSFILDLFNNSENAAIVNAIISLAHSLKMSVIAEGVESEKQLQFLRHSSCDEIQGFLFSRPLPPEEFSRLLNVKQEKWIGVV